MRTAAAVLNSKPLSECSTKEIKLVRSAARAHATRKGKEYLADDFASYVYEDLVKQGHLIYNLHWLWATFLRGERGSLRHKKGRAKALARAFPAPIEEARNVVDIAPLPDAADPGGHLWSHFKGKERMILVLTIKWGMTYREIGEVFGCTPQNIQRIMSEIEITIDRKGLRRKVT